MSVLCLFLSLSQCVLLYISLLYHGWLIEIRETETIVNQMHFLISGIFYYYPNVNTKCVFVYLAALTHFLNILYRPFIFLFCFAPYLVVLKAFFRLCSQGSFWQVWGHMECQRSDMGWPCARQISYPLYHHIGPIMDHLKQ